jgi:Lrp/AsnC family transcriptional regulator for asnA, asnC and gidA
VACDVHKGLWEELRIESVSVDIASRIAYHKSLSRVVPTQRLAPFVDSLDSAIVEHLQLDGRKPYTEIAQALGVSEGTVRNRVSRLVEERILHVVAMVDPHNLGMDAPALIGVTLQPGDWDPAIGTIANFEEVSYLVLVSGEFDLLVEVMCRDRDHLAEFLNAKLRRVPGVVHTRTFTILRTYKMAWSAKPILSPPAHSAV